MIKLGTNPLTQQDYPDVDVIRVDDTYYMCSTTMYFMPGGAMLRSYDLVNWELMSHVYDVLEDTPKQRLDKEEHAYGRGMWAPCLRYHNGLFHVFFVANDTGKTYHFTASDPKGPWKKDYVEGFYHDLSVLFDDDGRVYMIYGQREVKLIELESDCSKPKENGINKTIIVDENCGGLGWEGSHLYKINGKYYAFFIHSRKDRWFREEGCYMADSIEGPWVGGPCITDDFEQVGRWGAAPGVAQGGIVDTPDGEWFGLIFGDKGAVGRIPHLVPMTWGEDGFPIFEAVTKEISHKSTRPDYEYAPLWVSDDFTSEKLNEVWEFNHIPRKELYSVGNGEFKITTGKIAKTVEFAQNTLTQRTRYPECSAYVTLDASSLNDGDCAGICVLQYYYGLIGIEKRDGGYKLVMRSKVRTEEREGLEVLHEEKTLSSPKITLRAECHFAMGGECCEFYYLENDSWTKLGITQKLNFDLRHFTGARFGLFNYSTLKIGGTASFKNFIYE